MDRVRPYMVALVLQSLYKVKIDLVLGHVRYVFHGNQLGLDALDELFEGIQKRPLAIVAGISALVVRRERLTRSAACQELDSARAVPRGNILHLGDIHTFRDEFGAIIRLIGEFAVEIDVVASAYADAGLEQTRCQSSRTTKKVNGVNIMHGNSLLTDVIVSGSGRKIEVEY